MNQFRYGFDRKRIPVLAITKVLAIIPLLMCLCGAVVGMSVPSQTTDLMQAGPGATGMMALGGYALGNCLRDVFDPEKGAGGGSAVADEEKAFREKVIEGVQKTRESHRDLEKRIGELDSEAKKAQETITKAIQQFDNSSAQTAELTKAIQKLQVRMATLKSGLSGSRLDNILADEEKRHEVNSLIRGVLHKRSDRVAINDDQKKTWGDLVEKAVTTGTSPGSTYVNDDLNTDIYSLIAEYGVWNMFDVIPASAKTTKLIVDDTDPAMLFVDEGTEPAESSYTGSTVSAAVEKMLGWLSVTTEALEDSEIDLAGHIMPKFANATAFRMDHIAIAADGTADANNKGFSGVFNAGTTVTAATGKVTVAQLTLQDFLNALLAVDASVLSKPGAGWIVHPRQLVRIIGIVDGNGRSIFQSSLEAPAYGGIGSILGFPVYLSHAAPSTEAASARIISFGDPMGEAVLLRRDLQMAVSEEAKFLEDKVVFRARARAAAKIKKSTAWATLRLAAS